MHGSSKSARTIEQFKPDYYDLVVSDVKMPIMNGFQLCRKIREQDPTVRFYFLSAYDIYAKSGGDVPNTRLQGLHQETNSI
ncbi:MAG: response regulator [Thaumarchaeota archaeon]|nr:MAG: response regulator [Nitrososphaerota archaeon]